MSDTFTAVCLTREQAHDAITRGYEHAKAMLANDATVLVSIGPAQEPIGIKQRRFFHGAVLRQISEQVSLGGQRYTIDTWKEHYRRKYLGDGGFRWVSMKLPGAKRATPRRVAISTEDLGNRAYSKFVNDVIDDAIAELNVAFVFNTEEQQLLTRKPAQKGLT